ncbi:MAG: hypothetical protein CFE50_11645 [Pseudomonas sp. PGPPP4]|uniref:S8 family serine peptidase n=1 Tax=Pseudomonas sp. PGPPP4 TaxID=2015556 RepID=UPI000BD59B5A|nr:S8 family serine peptidase [Pseudomonas sp. PGPPP4]OYT83625.1 MAG: hypothetical protein CFE50_11645 [Pseudomonas sp. PGPPP4]
MAEGNGKPLLNPVLNFMKEPVPFMPDGRGKSVKGIVVDRLEAQRKRLSKSLMEISAISSEIPTHKGRTHLIARMFDDSHAPTWTPKDIFAHRNGCQILAPAFNGFLIEAPIENLEKIASKLKSAESTAEKVDISRVESIKIFDSTETMRGRSIRSAWKNADSGNKKEFIFWLLPFFDVDARKSVASKIIEFYRQNKLEFGNPKFENPFQPNGDSVRFNPRDKPVDPDLLRVLREYVKNGAAAFSARVASAENLSEIAASGTSYRIEPVVPIGTAALPPGNGKEPTPLTGPIDHLPVVVVFDGGLSAKSYKPLEFWAAPPLVPDRLANQIHGNRVTSLVCQAHEWNNNLSLPDHFCRFVTAQAITKDDAPSQPTHEQFISYLRSVAEHTAAEAKVWNLSFNERSPSKNPDEISFLGHEINKIAREFDILPVISIGNSSAKNSATLCAPADCESAITVSGRSSCNQGYPAEFSPISLKGPAPAGMRKPDVSWFSKVRTIGGDIVNGTSYSTPLVSSLAAHTFANLKKPTPDLVRALLLNNSELDQHCNELGWGTPWSESNTPWICADGTVTLAWVSKLKPGYFYYWNDIPVPPEMLVEGKLAGRASLTAILKPIVSELGGTNYFSTRVQVALQALSANGRWKNLLGSMKESKSEENEARSELAKWCPIRRHSAPFSRTTIQKNSMRLNARVYTRDLYQYGLDNHGQLEEQEVAFVLTFEAVNRDNGIYNSMTNRLGTFVESAVVEQGIDVILGDDT